jgi:hypothetical protein
LTDCIRDQSSSGSDFGSTSISMLRATRGRGFGAWMARTGTAKAACDTHSADAMQNVRLGAKRF